MAAAPPGALRGYLAREMRYQLQDPRAPDRAAGERPGRRGAVPDGGNIRELWPLGGRLKEAYHVLEVAFWDANGDEKIQRTHYTADTLPGLSHQPHVILNQAKMNGLMIKEIQRVSGKTGIEYGAEVAGVQIDTSTSDDPDSYCVTTKVLCGGAEKIFRSKYVLVSAYESSRSEPMANLAGL